VTDPTILTLNTQNILQIIVPTMGLVIAGIWYHLSSMARVSTVELEMKNIEDRLESLEDRLKVDLERLEDKLDRMIYAIAAHRAPQLSKDANI
jgi:hypothetical protein